MRSIPPEVLLSWPVPNYSNPVTRGYALVAVNSIFIALVIIIVSLRLYTRLWIKRWFGLDDVFIILALVFTIALTILVLLANQSYGWDRHIYDIPFTKIEPTLQIAMSAKVIFTCAASFTRLSLLCFYYRLVQDSRKRWFHWGIHANVAFSVGIFITFVCLSIFQCHPVRMYWSFEAPDDKCLNEGTITLSAGIINCVADLFCTTLPIPMVMRLQMPRRQRIAVVVLFSLGLIVTIAGIVRTWYIYKSLVAEYDLTWYAYPLWIAAAVEIDLGVICASAPMLRPLLTKIPISLSTISSKFTMRSRSSHALPSEISTNIITSGTTLREDPGRNSNHRLATSSKGWPELAEEDTEGVIHYDIGSRTRQWDDVDRGLRNGSINISGSQDAILGSEAEGEEKVSGQEKKSTEKLVTITELTTPGTTQDWIGSLPKGSDAVGDSVLLSNGRDGLTLK